MKLLDLLQRLKPTMASEGYGPLAAVLPEPTPPKPPSGQSTYPAFRKQVASSSSAIPKLERRLANTDTLTLRTAATTKAAVRNFAIASPDLSAATAGYLRVGIPESYTLIAYTMDGQVSPSGTQLAQEILRRVTYVPDYTQGFNAFSSLDTLANSLGKELLWYGSAALEVVLDPARLPIAFVPVHTPSITFYEDDQGIRPVQIVGGEEIDLDIPTFLYTSVDQDLQNAYSDSMLEAALQPVLADQDFMNDLRRVLKRSVHPRVTATLIEEKLRKAAPLEYQNDPTKLQEFMAGVLSSVETTLNSLNPEDAIVGFDSVEVGYMEGNQGNISENIKAVQELINAKVATGAKTMPAVLGHAQGGTHASTEALLYVKFSDVIRRKLNELFSRALTISTRLLGEDVVVMFRYASIDLRPEGELEAYKSMFQSRILEQLSLGMITDEEASLLLTGNLPPAGAPKLSGTMFRNGKTETQNPNSQTSNMNNELKPSTPASPKSPRKA